jgi:hypothetical protein
MSRLPAPPRRAAGLLALAVSHLCAWTVAAAAEPDYYSLDDFQRVGKIDAHVHLHGTADKLMAQALQDNFSVLTINVDYPDYPPLPEQERAAVSLRQRYPGRVAFAGAFTSQNFNTPGWTRSTLHQIDVVRQEGAVGVKIWKSIGMSVKDTTGHYVMPDDSRLDPIIGKLEHDHLVLLGHQAEPLNCWLPFDKMTVRSDQEYFREHPQYYMLQHPEMPSHDEILAARDRMLKKHPALSFDGVHLASLEWDVDEVAGFLDRFPQARVDLAARLVHLEYQAAQDPDKVRRMLIRYQDRILYGSDDSYGPDDSNPGAVAEIHSGWVEDWRFLATSDAMHSRDFEQPFHGLHLPRSVIDKIYRQNAQALFPAAWK